MTVDDENSIYVGGLPYDCTEETLRRTFDLYGSVVAVKLQVINDREVGGKCYGFVTFTNPRSAVNAISDMNGRTIGGRVVRVNEVRTRGGRPNFHRENFRRDIGRDVDLDRDRDRERDYIRDRDRYRDRNIERSRERDRERERDYEHGHESDRARDHAFERSRDIEDHDQERIRDHDRDWERDHDVDWDRDVEMDGTKEHDVGRDKDKEHQSRNRPGARISDRRSRELSSNSSDDYHGQVKEELESSINRREDLRKELNLIEEKVKEKEQLVTDLQKKSKKLEDALADARQLSSQRKSILTKLHKCYLQSKDYTERLKSSEKELQMLVDMTSTNDDDDDDDLAEDANARNGSAHANGLLPKNTDSRHPKSEKNTNLYHKNVRKEWIISEVGN